MLKQTVFSILIVSDSAGYNDAISDFLPKSLYEPVVFAYSVNEARRLVNERFFDIIVINAPLNDESGIEFIKELSREVSSALLFSAHESRLVNIKYSLRDLGIFTLSRPASSRVISQTLDDLCSARARLKQYESQIVSVEDKMTQIRHVNQAKLLLMENEGMTEKDAQSFILRQSMNSHVSKDVIALQTISKYAT